MTKKSDPKYQTISRDIISRIESGELQAGDRVPSENELIKMYKVSNTTARKSLLEIEFNGWATRVKGKGTFVLNRSEDKRLTRVLGSFRAMKESFNDNLIKEGFTPKNIILEKTVIETGFSAKINARHYIIEGPVLKIHRLRYANDMLLKDETRFVSMKLCPKINLLNMDQSLLKVFEDKYKLVLEDAQRVIGTTVIYPDDPGYYFENDLPLAIFILDGAILCNNGKVVEIERSFYRGDKYTFAIDTKPLLIAGKK